MASNGRAGNGSSADDVAGLETDGGTPQRKNTLHNYNSFPGYNTVQYETSNGYETTQHTAAGGKLQTRVLGPDLLRGICMMLMAMDHLVMALRSWEHGQGNLSEADGLPITKWNRPVGYVVRSLTHICAPGFMLLLGMGVVYLGNSRKKQGWSSLRLLRYFAIRMVVLTLVMVAQGLAMTGGQMWFLNIVLFAMAVNYFLAGAIWILVYEAEKKMTEVLTKTLTAETTRDHDSDSDAEQPLLHAGRPQVSSAERRATKISQAVLNAVLAILCVITIFWNIWLSADGGECAIQQEDLLAAGGSGMDTDTPLAKYWWLHLFFWGVSGPGVISAFPPLAWLSFAIFGILYGRLVIGSPRSTHVLVRHIGLGLVFTIVFVLTRLLHFGNLSENCLQTPENKAHPKRNQYLVSPAAFFYLIKYPPDVAFWAYTLAANMFLLGALRKIPINFAKRWLTIVLDFGTTALFFYLVHFPVMFLTGWVMCTLFGKETENDGTVQMPISAKKLDNVFGFFGTWMLCLVILWPLCRWYGNFKFSKPADSLWRMF